jgi:hypothetical protein
MRFQDDVVRVSDTGEFSPTLILIKQLTSGAVAKAKHTAAQAAKWASGTATTTQLAL